MSSSIVQDITLDNQLLMYDRIDWKTEDKGESLAQNQYSSPPEGVSPDEVYWEFDVNFSKTGSTPGLVFSNVNIRNSLKTNPSSTETLFDQISFTDLQIKFKGDTGWTDFDFTKSIDHFSWAEQGTPIGEPNDSPIYQRGFRSNFNLFYGNHSDTFVWLSLQLSVVLQKSSTEFDPGRTQKNMQIFPQIAWRWDSIGRSPRFESSHIVERGTNSLEIEQFRGTVKMIENPKKQPPLMMENHTTNSASFFTDTNDPPIYFDGRKREDATGPDIIYAQFWANLFDYIEGDLEYAREIMAAYDAQDPTGGKSRKKSYKWPPNNTNGDAIKVKKDPRQGDYDNVHVHGKMMNSIFGEPGVHAPFCGRTCMHLHWRWGWAGPVLSAVWLGSKKYKGWSEDEPNSSLFMPLIPPNQKLRIAITTPSHIRFNAEYILDPNGNNITLDQHSKAVWYCTEVKAPKKGRKQVILEHGLGYAYSYYTAIESTLFNATTVFKNKEKFKESAFPGSPSRLQQIYDLFEVDRNETPGGQGLQFNLFMIKLLTGYRDEKLDEIYMCLYDLMRYFYDDEFILATPDQIAMPQVPSGTHNIDEDGNTITAMRDL